MQWGNISLLRNLDCRRNFFEDFCCDYSPYKTHGKMLCCKFLKSVLRRFCDFSSSSESLLKFTQKNPKETKGEKKTKSNTKFKSEQKLHQEKQNRKLYDSAEEKKNQSSHQQQNTHKVYQEFTDAEVEEINQKSWILLQNCRERRHGLAEKDLENDLKVIRTWCLIQNLKSCGLWWK